MFFRSPLSAELILTGNLQVLSQTLLLSGDPLSPSSAEKIQRDLKSAQSEGSSEISRLLDQADTFVRRGDSDSLRHTWLRLNVALRGLEMEDAPALARLPKPKIPRKMEFQIEMARERIFAGKKIVILTGAGVSQESGVPTFRGAGGLWRNHDVAQVANPKAFRRDPRFVWEFYEYRRKQLQGIWPNPGHYAIAALQVSLGNSGEVTLLTQNVDELHALAGFRNPVELHGNIWHTRCTGCGEIREDRRVPLPQIPPFCESCSEMLRPHIVWFGENYDPVVREKMYEAAQTADIMVVAGTSGAVATAPSLVSSTKKNGGYVIEINAKRTDSITPLADQTFLGKSGEILPFLLEEEDRLRAGNGFKPGLLFQAPQRLSQWAQRVKRDQTAWRWITGEFREKIEKEIQEFSQKELFEVASIVEGALSHSNIRIPSSALNVLTILFPFLEYGDRREFYFRVAKRAFNDPGTRLGHLGFLEKNLLQLRKEDQLSALRYFRKTLGSEDKNAIFTAAILLSRLADWKTEDISERVIEMEALLGNADENIVGIAINSLSRMIPNLEEEGRWAHETKVEAFLDNPKHRLAAMKAVSAFATPSDPIRRVQRALKIEAYLSDPDPHVRQAVLSFLERMASHLEPEVRFSRALAITSALGDPDESVRHAGLRALSKIANCLTPEETLKLTLHMDSLLIRHEGSQPASNVIIKALHIVHQSLKPSLQARGQAKKTLDDPEKTLADKEDALRHFVHSYGKTLSFGAMRLLLLKGLKRIRGNESHIVLFSGSEESGVPSPVDTVLGENLMEFAGHLLQTEAALKGHLTVGGKLRGFRTNPLVSSGFPSGRTRLIKGEESPLLLWPVQAPHCLTETIWLLLDETGDPRPFDYKTSLTFGGDAGDDLKYAALAVHALLPQPYPFPKKIKSPAGITWFAPIVDGGGSTPRYDHLFLQFAYPPSADYFRGGTRDEWRDVAGEFIVQGSPTILAVDPEKRRIEFKMKAGDQWKNGMLYLKKKDWIRFADDRNCFGTLLFVEMARMNAYQELSRVVEAAWGLGVLREANKQDKNVLPFSSGFTVQKVRKLKDLALDFEKEMTALLQNANLEALMKTRWVGNTNWSKIRRDMVLYQQTLQKHPAMRKAVQALAERTILRVKEILFSH